MFGASLAVIIRVVWFSLLFSLWWENHSWFSSKEKHYYHLSKKKKRKNTITKRVMELTWKFWVVHSCWTAFSWNAMDSTNFGKNVVYCIVDFMSSWICQDLIVGHELITKFHICIYSCYLQNRSTVLDNKLCGTSFGLYPDSTLRKRKINSWS